MKKILTILSLVVALSLGTFSSINTAEAAYPSVSTALGKNDTSKSSSRLTIGKTGMHVTVGAYWNSKQSVRYTIFKDGTAWSSGLVKPNQTSSFHLKASNVPSGKYSIRLYCGSSGSNTGCGGQGTLVAK